MYFSRGVRPLPPADESMIHDALVIGGGPAGATVAWLLARSGWKVVLLEKSVFPRRKVCGEFISATSMPLLHNLGIDAEFLEMAGPPVRRVGLYAGAHRVDAPMPVSRAGDGGLGRALGREHLDAMLLDGAKRAGAEVLQPCTGVRLRHGRGIQVCTAKEPKSNVEIRSRVVIAAHGSWEKGNLPAQARSRKRAASDLLAFKAHFTRSGLPDGLMPLIAFPGGYGGMVNTDHGRVTLSCCIRRDALKMCRDASSERRRASEAVMRHILAHSEGVQLALGNAGTIEPWLSAGPVRPGIHFLYENGVFGVGNTAGEAHPVVAEGISMALQGAWLLSELLLAGRSQALRGNTDSIGRAYARAWCRHFHFRLRAAAVVAQIAMRPEMIKPTLPVFRRVPDLLTICTRLSGKTAHVISV